MVIAQAPRDHFRQPHQHRVQRGRIRRIDRKRMLVADRFRVAAFADFSIEPAACVLAARFPGQREPPFSETFFEQRAVERRQIAHLADAAGVEIPFRHLADSGNLANVERRQKLGFLAWNDPQYAIRLSLIGRDFGDQPRRRGADGTIQVRGFFHGAVQALRGG